MSRPIRLAYLITDLKVGGVPLHLYRLATRLPPARIEPRVICLASEGPVAGMLRRGGVPVTACGARGPWDVSALGRLWRTLRNDPPDVLHGLLFHANLAARLVGPAAGVPIGRILCEIQTVERERPWHLVVDNLTCRLCRCEIGNSPSVLEHLHGRAHLPRSRLCCQWGAVDAEAIERAEPASRRELGLADSEAMVLWTGRLDPVKGFEEMLAGFARATAGRRARLLLAGEGAYRPTVERLIGELGLSGRAELLGQRSDVPALLRAADLFVFCSRTEGLPNAVLEAMAAGLPVVATDVPGSRDLIRDGETGLLVRAGSAEEIAAGITRMLANPELARELGARARAWVRGHADLTEWTRRWVRFYESVAASGSLASRPRRRDHRGAECERVRP